ncbi:lysine biosynthesis protein LysX [Anaerolineae bacterium CFX7]|nr:lysine biosynthesis protein LysX [Anaerolineae bacterium CFX7]
MKIGLIYSRVRFEEKQIIAALERRGVAHDLIDDREIVFNLTPQYGGHPEKQHGVKFARPEKFLQYDVALDRAMEFTRGLYALQILNSWGVQTVNRASVVAVCGDKLLTTAALSQHNVPSPRTEIAFTPEAALEAIENMGYPVVIKPVIGSWGRLVAKINDREAAEALLEHKAVLGHFLHEIFYLQEFIAKPGRDIRLIMLGDEIVSAIYRSSAHWVTNTARGATAQPCPLDAALETIARNAARAVGGGFLAIDVIEDPQRGYLVNEINPTPEFRGSETATGADIPNRIIDYLLQEASSK